MRMISNVRVLAATPSGVRVGAKFITFRSKNGTTDSYFGHHLYELRPTSDGMRIGSKRSVIDSDTLRPQGRVSIIL